MTPQGTVSAELQAPVGGMVDDDFAGLGGLLPLGLVVRRVEERGGSIQERAGLQGEGGDAGGAADLAVHLGDVGHRQVRRDGIELIDDELHDLVGRRAGDAVGLRIAESRGHERHVAVGAEQLEVEVRPQETELIREQFHLLDPVDVVGIVLPLGDVRLIQFLQIHARVGDGGIALRPGAGIGIRRAPAAVHVVVHGAGLQCVLSLVGSPREEVSAVARKLVVIHLRIHVEHHVLDAFREVFVGPFLVARVLLGIVEVHARSRNDTGENE